MFIYHLSHSSLSPLQAFFALVVGTIIGLIIMNIITRE